jgi:hypothetical protein
MAKRIVETNTNIRFCVSVINTSILIIVHDIYTTEISMKFFDTVNDAKKYISSIDPHF